jgi:hypothetical protein
MLPCLMYRLIATCNDVELASAGIARTARAFATPASAPSLQAPRSPAALRYMRLHASSVHLCKCTDLHAAPGSCPHLLLGLAALRHLGRRHLARLDHLPVAMR